jgi:hypothetical protein
MKENNENKIKKEERENEIKDMRNRERRCYDESFTRVGLWLSLNVLSFKLV